ncbi:MAG TPA: PQQ-binding-like beta-propeller repeat protein [Gemmataceae bacterium]
MRACLARCPRCCPALLLLILLTPGARMEAAPGVDRFGDPLPDGATARLGTIRQRVAASQIAVSADGRTLFTVAVGRAISRWDAATGRQRDHRLLPGKPTSQFWLSPDGRLLAVAEDKSVAVFDTETGACKRRLAVAAQRVAFHPDGKTAATAEYDKPSHRIRLWDLATGKDRLLTELPSYVNALAFSPDGKRLFAAVDNHSLRGWDVESGEEIWRNNHWASNLAVSPDGRTLCTDTYQRSELHLWDADTGRRIGGGSTGERRWVGRLAFSPDGRTVFLAAYKDVLLWDVAAGKVRRRLAGAGSPFVLAPDGKTLASIHSALLRRWDVETGKPLYPDTSERGHTGAVCGVVFTPDGRAVVTAGADETIRVWDLSTQRPRTLFTGVRPRYGALITWSPDSGRTHSFSPQFLAVTADSRRLLSDAGDNQLRLSDIRTGEEVRRFDVRIADNKAWMGAARLSADGRTLWTLTYPPPSLTSEIRIKTKGTLIDWDVATGQRLAARSVVWPGDQDDFVIAPDGRTVALAHGSVRDVASGKECLKQPNPPLSYPCVFSADGRLVAAMADREHWNALAVYELLTGRLLLRVQAPVSWYSRFAFSPDGRLLIASGRDALHVWEVSSGRRLLHLPAEGRSPTLTPGLFAICLAVAPDGRSAATGHEDGTVLLWDLAPAWRRLAERPAGSLTDAELGACWADLLKDDPRTAYATMDRLTTTPARAMRLFRKHLRPVTIDPQWLADRMAALDNADFAAREKASRDLAGIAETIEPRLRRELEQTSSAEVRSRLHRLLETTRSQVLPAETMRQLRAAAVLEHIATAEARALLRELAQGEPGDRLTGAANAALARLTAVHVP